MNFGTAEARASLRTLATENPADIPAVPPVPTERVPVPFEGEGSGTAPMTWGQAEIWRTMSAKGWLSLGGTLPLAPGATVEGAAEELRYMTSRFPSMRTRWAFDDDQDLPNQALSASGETVLEVYDAQDARDAEELAALVDLHYRTAPRDLENEWPVRMAVVRGGGAPLYMVVFSCHLVTDGGGAQIIARDMAARDTPPPAGTELLDLARWQHSEAGRRRSEGALLYWEKTLPGLEPRPFPPSGDRQEPRHWTGELTSPALNLAVQVIAGRTRAGASSVLLALYAIALGRRGISPAVLRPQANNRFRRGLTPMVTNLVQAGLCVMETADSTVDQVVARAKREAMNAFKNAYHDPAHLEALLERDAGRRGPGAVPWDGYTWACLNDRTPDNQEPDPEPVTPARLREALGRTEFTWHMKKDNPLEPLYLHISVVDGAVSLTLCADTDRFGPADIEGLVRDMEAVAVAAAFDAEVPTGVA